MAGEGTQLLGIDVGKTPPQRVSQVLIQNATYLDQFFLTRSPSSGSMYSIRAKIGGSTIWVDKLNPQTGDATRVLRVTAKQQVELGGPFCVNSGGTHMYAAVTVGDTDTMLVVTMDGHDAVSTFADLPYNPWAMICP